MQIWTPVSKNNDRVPAWWEAELLLSKNFAHRAVFGLETGASAGNIAFSLVLGLAHILYTDRPGKKPFL